MSDWNQFIAVLVDFMGFGLLTLAVLTLAGLVALLWFTWPAWSPARWRMPRWRLKGWRMSRPRWRLRWPRFRWPRFRWRRRRKKRDRATTEVTEAELDTLAASVEELPDVAPAVFASLADRLAAEGRYAEAVRERLRSMVRELVDHQVVAPRPGWTVTELARAAAGARPTVGPPLNDATQVFSTIWYGDRSALPEDDALMRAYAGRLHELVGDEQR
jgi:hypothetical protein